MRCHRRSESNSSAPACRSISPPVCGLRGCRSIDGGVGRFERSRQPACTRVPATCGNSGLRARRGRGSPPTVRRLSAPIDSASWPEPSKRARCRRSSPASGLEAGTGGELPDTGALLGAGQPAGRGRRPRRAARRRRPARSSCTARTRPAPTTGRRPTDGTAVVVKRAGGDGLRAIPADRRPSVGAAPAGRMRRSSSRPPTSASSPIEGIDEGWLTELLSPAFTEWLQRSPDDWGAEYAERRPRGRPGVGDHRPADELEGLCGDAARIATALSEEALEASEAGGGKAAKNTQGRTATRRSPPASSPSCGRP